MDLRRTAELSFIELNMSVSMLFFHPTHGWEKATVKIEHPITPDGSICFVKSRQCALTNRFDQDLDSHLNSGSSKTLIEFNQLG